MNIQWNDGTTVHDCEGARIIPFDPGTFLVWTKCGIDVPANQGVNGTDAVTCKGCSTGLNGVVE